jgi:toxin ParE1/3/4
MRASQHTQRTLTPAVPGKKLKLAFVLVYLTDQLMRHLIVKPEAEADIIQAASWYESREQRLGLEFLSDIQRSITRALHNPKAFLRFRTKPEVRRVLTRLFPYRIYFILKPDVLVVFAVLHAARNDRIWRQRLRDA